MGELGLLLAIIVLVIMAYRGFGAIPASIICSLIVILTNGIPLWQGFSEFYISGFTYFAGNYLLVFFSSALFAKAMDQSGSAQAIAYSFLEWFGAKRAVLVLIVSTAVLTYGGVSLFVVIFAIYPIALVLFKEANLSKKMLPGILAFGAATFTMTALPATPQLTNVIPAQILGTSMTAAPAMGIFASILMFISGYWYFARMEKRLKLKGEGFVPAPTDDMSRFENVDKSKLPGKVVAFIPMIVILAAIIFIRDIFQPIELVVYAMIGATVLVFAMNWNRIPDKKKVINEGLKDGTAIFNVAVIIGFGFVVQNAPAFQSFIKFALGIKTNPYLSAVLAVEIVAGITGSSSGGLTIFLKALGEQYVNLGANPSILHRLTAIAAGGLDTLPHAGGIFIMLGVMGMNHKEGYAPIFWTTVVFPIIIALICTVIAIFVY